MTESGPVAAGEEGIGGQPAIPPVRKPDLNHRPA
ncbi:hypothetical protein HNQ63_002566 [Wenzhouxiangella marina]|uniref:Uncharacterized protein n=1 Tax=Wenzhouxiangella marina TaxID=1579979 RepID=A0A0K0XU60_9GAMM|nr:hypothetical protein WM2015_827 [Wenzhouxiangella marina]MBB6088088.1 hypothetical protein [Wenzhouxiangella marina]